MRHAKFELRLNWWSPHCSFIFFHSQQRHDVWCSHWQRRPHPREYYRDFCPVRHALWAPEEKSEYRTCALEDHPVGLCFLSPVDHHLGQQVSSPLSTLCFFSFPTKNIMLALTHCKDIFFNHCDIVLFVLLQGALGEPPHGLELLRRPPRPGQGEQLTNCFLRFAV